MESNQYLADDKLEYSSMLEFNKRHMCDARSSLVEGHLYFRHGLPFMLQQKELKMNVKVNKYINEQIRHQLPALQLHPGYGT